jgi:hypothetical protein
MISEFKHEKCCSCGMEGFDGRKNIFVEHNCTFWVWVCKFCKKEQTILAMREV